MKSLSVQPSISDQCNGFVDYGRRIGGDPVGRKCWNHGTEIVKIHGIVVHLCKRCAEFARNHKNEIKVTL